MKTLIYTLSTVLIIMLIYYYWPTDKKSHVIKTSNKNIILSDLAGKTESQVLKTLGYPTNKQTVNPSDLTSCPCLKAAYLNEQVEIVYINGKADWITVETKNLSVKKGNNINYISYDVFEDYVYLKVYTR